jgi:iron complex outermembrane receptor protein
MPTPLLSLLALAVSLSAEAAPVDPFSEQDEADLFRAEERVVTVATRFAQTVEQAPSLVTVLTDAELRARGCRSLADALAQIPGIYITTSKEGRSLAWFRGVVSPDNNKILLLLDGVPWYDGVYAHAWIDDYVPLVNVKQIEVIKGPGSAVYGTNAFAGVVNVVTYRAADLQGGFARAEVGSDGRRGMSVVVADRLSPRGGEVRAYARSLELDGLGVDVSPKGNANVNAQHPRRALSAGFTLNLGGLEAGVQLFDYQHTYFTNEQDDPLDVLFAGMEDFRFAYQNVGAQVRYTQGLGALGQVSPYAYAQRFDNPGTYAFLGDPVTTAADDGSLSTSLTGRLVKAEKTTHRYGGGVEVQAQPGPSHTTVGGVGAELTQVVQLEDVVYDDFSHDPVTPSTFGIAPGKELISDLFAYAQHTWTATWWMEVTGGLRGDYQNYFGFFASPRAGLLLIPTEGLTVKMLYGRAFRAPTARELLVRVVKDDAGNNVFTAGNPNLRPEQIDTIESEVAWVASKTVKARVAGFTSFIGQEINLSNERDPVLGDAYFDNRGEARAVGGEAEGEWDPGRASVNLSYSFTQATDLTLDTAQYGFPTHMGRARLGLELVDGLSLNVVGEGYSARPRADWSPDAGLPDGAPFGLVHLGLATGSLADDRVRVDVGVHNLLNTQYKHLIYLDDANATTTDDSGATVAKYPSDIDGEGRVVTVGAELRF